MNRKEHKQYLKNMFEELKSIDFFRGSLEEYEKWKGYKCEILGPSYKIPDCWDEIKEDDVKMIEAKLEALVNIQFYDYNCIEDPTNFIGLPIRRKF